MTEENQFVFHGKVMPQRARVDIGPVDFETMYGKGTFSIYASQIVATVNSSEEIDEINIYTMRNVVKKFSNRFTDTLSFTHGMGYRVEITNVLMPDGSRRTFGVDVGSLREKLTEDEERFDMFDTIHSFAGEQEADYLRRIMKDLRWSTEDPADTGFFCYRSMETIRKYFEDMFSLTDDEEGWVRMREELDVEKDRLLFLRGFAQERRHGGKADIDAEDRAEIFSEAWDIIHEFILYLEDSRADAMDEV